MTTVGDVAALIEGAVNYSEAVQRCQAAGLATILNGEDGHIQVGATVAVYQIGSNAISNAYWIVYDVTNTSIKAKVRGANP